MDTNTPPNKIDKEILSLELKKLEEEKAKQLEELRELEEIEKKIEGEKAEIEKKIRETNHNFESEVSNDTDEDSSLRLASLKTYQGDIASAISRKKESLVTIKLAEDKKQKERTDVDDSSKKIYWFIPVLFIAGIVIIAVSFFLTKNETAILTPPAREHIISYDDLFSLTIADTKRENLLLGIKSLKEKTYSGEDKIFEVQIREKSGTTTESETLTRLLLDPLPEELRRTFEKERFMGVYVESNRGYPFFIFKINSYEKAFSSLLLSEENIKKDFVALINSSESNSEEELEKEFTDVYVENKDARALKNIFGKTLLIYSFIDTETLVFAHNEKALSDIITRYLTIQSVK